MKVFYFFDMCHLYSCNLPSVSSHCSLSSILYYLSCSVLYSLFSVLFSRFCVLGSLFSVFRRLPSVLCSLSSILCPWFSSVLCPQFSTPNFLSSVLSSLFLVVCSLSLDLFSALFFVLFCFLTLVLRFRICVLYLLLSVLFPSS